MPSIRADLRAARFEPQPEAVRAATVLCARIQDDQIALAKALETVDRTAAFLAERAASIGEFVARRGLSPFQGRALCFVGRAMRVFPWVEPGLREGRIGFDQAESLGQLGSYEGTRREDDDWETWARLLPLRTFRRRVRRRIEIVRQKTSDLVSFQTHLTRQAFADYERARILASRKARRALSRGETVATVLRDYNRRHDPEEKQPGPRRAGDTSDPSCRTVPAEVLRACLERYGDRCWVPGCTNEIFLETMHLEPKRDGGSQEATNIDRGCHRHHLMYDAGTMWLVGRNEQGLPIFETDEGSILHPDHPGRVRRTSAARPDEAAAARPPAPSRRSATSAGEASQGSTGGHESQIRDRPWPATDVASPKGPSRGSVSSSISRGSYAVEQGRGVRTRGPPAETEVGPGRRP